VSTFTTGSGNSLRIALIVSDAALRSSIRLLLTVSGMNVDEFRTGREFLAAQPLPCACIVIDCQLSDMPGRHLCAEVIRRSEMLPVIVLAAAPETFTFSPPKHPNLRVIAKPFDTDLLVAAIREVAVDGRQADGLPAVS